MYPLSIRSVCAIAAVVLMANMTTPASSQTESLQTASPTASPQATADATARCKQLIDYFDRYGAGRSEASDGARNMTRIGAGIDCANGHAQEGVKAMEDLLARKEFHLPPPAVGLSQSP
jgi:hypothetical protein